MLESLIQNNYRKLSNDNDFKDASLLREYPCSIEAEKCILGAFLLDNSIFELNVNGKSSIEINCKF